jgi:phosphoglycolate phosphatase
MDGGPDSAENLRLVAFDFDGTLVDSHATIVAAMIEAFEGRGRAAPAAPAVRDIIGLPLGPAVARLLPPGAPDQAEIAAIGDNYRTAYAALTARRDHVDPLFCGVREVLDLLDAAEILSGIVTSKSRRGLVRALASHDLVDRFVTLQTVDDGPGKPHPFLLERAMAEAGASPESTLMIGDTTYDIETARNAGVEAIGVAWGAHQPAALRAAGARTVLARFDELASNLGIT